MTNFPEYFGFTEQINLDQSFRLNDKICDFSSKFIMKNRDQIPKTLRSIKTVDYPAINIVWSKGDNKRQQKKTLLECLNEINSIEKDKISVFIIGRYHFLKPEGLPAIVTATLAIGVQRMAGRNAIIRKLPAVETLGSATVICSDKTGTMTKKQMTVRRIRLLDQTVDVEESKFLVDRKEIDSKTDSGLEILLRIGVLCNNSRIEHENGGFNVIGDPTEGALLIVSEEAGIKTKVINKEYPRLYEAPFDATKKRMVTINEDLAGDQVAYIKGAVEKLLDRSSKVYKNGEEIPITEEDKKSFLETNTEMAKHALRVLGFAYRKLDENEDCWLVLIYIMIRKFCANIYCGNNP